MRRTSRSPVDETLVAGKIVIENLPRRLITTSDIHTWLKKYGNILEIIIYKDCALVQFESDLEAAGAVQCEDQGQFFGAIVSVKHVEPGILSSIRRLGPPVDRFTAGNRRPAATSNTRERERDRERDRDRDSERERDRLRDRDRDRGRPRDRDVSPRGRFHDDSYDRRRRREEMSPRRRSRSPIGQRGDRRHVHPLNWLSEVAGTDKNASINGSASDSKALSNRSAVPYTVAIVAVQHDLVSYAEMIEKRVSACLKVPDHVDRSSVRTHIVVLLSADHLTPCLADLTKDGVPFAIICGTTNWAHGSCTLRILYVPTQQEHRNMPLDDAMVLLQKEYDAKLALERPLAAPPSASTVSNSAPIATPSAPSPAPVIPPDDHTFLAPTRDMSTLLRMLADSRILSIGELDEIAAFVQERKRRLEGRRLDSSADARTGNATDLKSRILNMIYPQTPGSAVSIDSYAGMSSFQSASNTMALQPSAPVSHSNRLGAGLANPVVQQAIDTLMRMPSTMPQVSTQQGANIDVMSRMNNQKGPTGAPQSRPYGQPMRGSFFSSRVPEEDRSKLNQSADGNTDSNFWFSSYKPPTGAEGSKTMQQGGNQQAADAGFKPPLSGVSRGFSQMGNEGGLLNSSINSTQTSARDDDAPTQGGWRSRRRAKRGGARANLSDHQQQQQQQKAAQPTSQKQPLDLMSANVTPVGTVAETYVQNPDPYKYTRKAPLLPVTGSLFGAPSAPFYMSHPGSFPYSGQPYY